MGDRGGCKGLGGGALGIEDELWLLDREDTEYWLEEHEVEEELDGDGPGHGSRIEGGRIARGTMESEEGKMALLGLGGILEKGKESSAKTTSLET